MPYLYLLIAVIFEILATSALKAAADRTSLGPVLGVAFGYALSFYFLALVLRTIPLGIAYAIWSGVGIVSLAAIGVVYYKESLDFAAVLGLGLIVAGILVVNLFSKTAGH
ncbi:MAG: multidrug efflux SMR transporter [Desulfobacterium sp.]|jgi:small multidrug resistance pump|nr:multidrug efflux SMR transporter [Desulfobacterium sp.]